MDDRPVGPPDAAADSRADAGPVVGIFGIGSDHYWPQFAGLREKLEGLMAEVRSRVAALGAVVVNGGLVDDPRQAPEVVARFSRAQVDAVFVHMTTYARSYTVLPIVRQLGVPVIVLNLQPTATLDFDAFNAIGDRGAMTGQWLSHCQAVSAPELSSVFRRSGIRFHLVTGYLEDEVAWRELEEWILALRVRRALASCIVGVLGHADNGMMDLYTDLTRLSAAFGPTFEIIEMAEAERLRVAVTDHELEEKVDEIRRVFRVSDECAPEEVLRQARTSCALDALVSRRSLGALAYYYEGSAGSEGRDLVTSIIAGNSLLTARGVPVAGECDIRTALAMKVLDTMGSGGTFSEFYYVDYQADEVLLGHDGPGHLGMAADTVELVPLPVYHGKPGRGLSIQMSVRTGPVTLLAVVDEPDGVSLLAAEGEAVPGPVLRVGNTNSRYRFSVGARAFVQRWSEAGPGHHCAIGHGHRASALQKLADLLGLRFTRVC